MDLAAVLRGFGVRGFIEQVRGLGDAKHGFSDAPRVVQFGREQSGFVLEGFDVFGQAGEQCLTGEGPSGSR